MKHTHPPWGILGKVFLSVEDERVYAMVRIGFCIAALLNLSLLWPLRETLLTAAGTVDAEAAVEQSEMGAMLIFHGIDTLGEITLLMSVAGAALVLLMAGIVPRAAAVAVFLWHVSLPERLPLAATGWDLVLRAFSFLILVSPLGKCWNLPDWWRGRARAPEQVARYGLILMRLQVAAIYFQTVLVKWTDVNAYWKNGEFLPYFLLSRYSRWPSAWVAQHADLLSLGTGLALAAEVVIPILLFIRSTRWIGALLGLLLHGSISVFARDVEPFMVVMVMSYLAFLRGEDLAWIASRLGKKEVATAAENSVGL